MIPQTSRQRSQDHYSVVVLDYPRREKQDIECFCIPSSNLEDHGYIPEHESVCDQRNDFGLGRPQLSPKKPQKNNLWNRLKPRTKSIRNFARPRNARRSAAATTKPLLTEEEMMKYISSQDDLDWSAAGIEDRPANFNPNGQPNIVEPLVQIQYGGGGDDVDDTVSAISQDTCWQDDAQGVVELVLPNVLFCDDRDDGSEQKDVNNNSNWNILFPSYIEECRENGRDDAREEASRTGCEDSEVKKQFSSERDEILCKKSEDEASISSTGWEDTVSESESETEEENASSRALQQVECGHPKAIDATISPLRDPDMSEKTIEAEEEEIVEVRLNENSKLPPPDLLIPTLGSERQQYTNDESIIADKGPSTEPHIESASARKTSNHLERSASDPASGRVRKGLFSCSPLRRSASGPRSRSPSRSRSPRRRFPRPSHNKESSTPTESAPETTSENKPADEDNKQNVPTEESLPAIALEPTTSAVKEIDVHSDGSLDSNLTNPSMFSSIQGSPPPSPPKGWMRMQRRRSITRYSTQEPTLDLSPITDTSTRMFSIASVISTAGSHTGDSKQEGPPAIDTTTSTGLFGGLWRRVLNIPAFIISRKANAAKEEASASGGSAAADDGDHADASWRSNSLGSLGGWSAFQDCEEGSSKWWELSSQYLIDQVSCATPSPAIMKENSAARIDNESKSPMDDDDSFTSAPAAVFEDAVEDEIEVVSLSTKSKAQECATCEDVVTEDGNDAWSAAKRGDITSIQKWTEDKSYDWSQKDSFGNTALFYACHSGAAINITIVKILLDQWPVDQIPADVLDRCKTNALNQSVVKMLEHPEKAEEIVSSAFRDYLLSNQEMTDDDESYHLTKWLLYDLAEEDEEDEEDY